jgi:hypothetical protein
VKARLRPPTSGAPATVSAASGTSSASSASGTSSASATGDAAAAPDGLVIGVLGCMAERLKSKLLSSSSSSTSSGVDLVVGPDAYRDLPALLLRLQAGYALQHLFQNLND